MQIIHMNLNNESNYCSLDFVLKNQMVQNIWKIDRSRMIFDLQIYILRYLVGVIFNTNWTFIRYTHETYVNNEMTNHKNTYLTVYIKLLNSFFLFSLEMSIEKQIAQACVRCKPKYFFNFSWFKFFKNILLRTYRTLSKRNMCIYGRC